MKSEAELLAAAKHAVSGHPDIEALRRAAFIAGWRACVAAIPLVKCATADCAHCQQIDEAAVVAEDELKKHIAEKEL